MRTILENFAPQSDDRLGFAYLSIVLPPPGVTVPLLTTSSGDKLGKTAGNAVWLTGSSYPLYQFLLQTGDHDVATCLHRLTSLPPEEVDVIMQQHTVSPRRGEDPVIRVSADCPREFPGPEKTG